jgi:hypothetical protein
LLLKTTRSLFVLFCNDPMTVKEHITTALVSSLILHSISPIQLVSNHLLFPLATELKMLSERKVSSDAPSILSASTAPDYQILYRSKATQLRHLTDHHQLELIQDAAAEIFHRRFARKCAASAHPTRARRVARRQTLVPHLQAAPLVSVSSSKCNVSHARRSNASSTFQGSQL